MKNFENTIFVTGTGTDVGKTLISAALCSGWTSENVASYWKPVQTGGAAVDSQFVKQMALATKIIPEIFQYEAALSPNQAARLEKRGAVSLAKLDQALQELSSSQPLIIEGAGGLEVPLNENYDTWLDFLSMSSLPVLLVASSGLGTLNHTMLSIEALMRTGSHLLGLVLMGDENFENQKDLAAMFQKRYGKKLSIFQFKFSNQDDIKRQVLSHSKSLLTFVHECQSQIENDQENLKLDTMRADRSHVWHPYTQHLTADQPICLHKAKGVWLYDSDGQRYLDGISSWWVNTVGHGRMEIQRAMSHQQATMDHVIFAGATHQPAAELAKTVSDLTDGLHSRVFFSDNGSTAVEVALKIAYQRWHQKGEGCRRKFLGLNGSYHGDTFGAMSVAAADGFHGLYEPFLFKGIFVDPVTKHHSQFSRLQIHESIEHIQALLAEYHQDIAAAIIEPLVQGAGGMLVQNEEWLRAYVALLQSYEIPVIFDEVFTGLGRVGADFAFKRLGVKPDIVCIAKGLTGGTMPLALTLAREEYFEDFLNEKTSTALLHGHSYTANPIACAAALAALQILKNESLAAQALEHERAFLAWAERAEAAGYIVNPRVKGAILAFEIFGSGESNYFHQASKQLANSAMQKGLFLRPLGNTVYFAPPLVLSAAERAFALQVLWESLKSTLPAP